MLDFRRNSKVPNYLAGSQQRRLLLLVGVAAVVALVAFQLGGQRGWFAQHEPPAPDEDRGGRRQQHRAIAADRDDRDAAADDLLFPGVRSDYLSTVEDDTVFRAAESDAWFHLLALLARTDQHTLDEASLGRVGYLQLDQQAASYRGRLVSIGGIVRSAKRVDAPSNGFGIEHYYQLWVQPERIAPDLVVVYALELPKGFPLEPELDAPCEATGFFFKRWAYHAQGGIRTAPVVLARSIDWQPPPVAPPEQPLGERMLWSLTAALVVAVLLVAVLVARQRSARANGGPQTTQPPPGDLDRVLSDRSP